MIKMKIKGLDHIQFIVKDLEESIDFFIDLGFTLERRTAHYGDSAELRMFSKGTIFEIHATKPNENPGYDHFAILVDDINSSIKELREKGIEIDDPHYVPETGRIITDFRDPSGYRWQLVGIKNK